MVAFDWEIWVMGHGGVKKTPRRVCVPFTTTDVHRKEALTNDIIHNASAVSKQIGLASQYKTIALRN